MRFVRWSAFIAWAVVALLAVAGFAAFTPNGEEAPPAAEAASSSVVAPASAEESRGLLAGRVAALAFASGGGAAVMSPTTVPDSLVESLIAIQGTSTTTVPRRARPTVRPAPVGSSMTCLASWYGPGFAGRTTANGEIFDPSELTAAMQKVRFGTIVTVTRSATGASVRVRINDRGPAQWVDGRFVPHPTRCIDLSEAAMRAIGGLHSGVVRVTVSW